MQDLSPDMHDLLRLFLRHKVSFALCGGFAVGYYGFIRTTMDLDLLIQPSRENAVRAMAALVEFGFGNAGIPDDAFAKPGTVVTLGVQPNQIDLLTSVSTESEDAIFADLQFANLWDMVIPVIGRKALLRAKQEAHRPKDLVDLDELTRIAELE